MNREGDEVDEEGLVLGFLWHMSRRVGEGVGRRLTMGLDPREK